MASELKPCAHCGSVAELDYEQPFCAFPSGKLEKQVAIYCTACDVHMSMCYSDFPEYDHDQMATILTEKWNTRPAPAATDTGLETVGYVTPEWLAKHCSAHTITAQPTPAWTEAVVTRSQAEELLAAEQEAQQRLLDIIEEANDDKEALEADNAAKDAQTDAYGLALMMIREGCENPSLVARKALERFGK